MARVHKRKSAKRDLIAQWVWFAETAGIETADRFLAAADATASMLASQPEAGVRVSALTKSAQRGMRRFPITNGFDSILLFYVPLRNGIDLVRVLHGSRDLAGLFSEE